MVENILMCLFCVIVSLWKKKVGLPQMAYLRPLWHFFSVKMAQKGAKTPQKSVNELPVITKCKKCSKIKGCRDFDVLRSTDFLCEKD